MGIKRSRPEEEGDAPGLVVFVARTVAQLERARAALAGASVPLGGVGAEAEAALAAGRPLALRVAPGDLRRAQDALDEAFPVTAPAEPDPEELSPSPAEVAARLTDSDDADAAPRRDGPLLDEMDHEPPPGEGAGRGTRDTPQRLEASAGKLLFIAAGSLAVPGIGALLGVFAAASAPMLLPRLQHEQGRRLAWAAFGIGVLSVFWNAWLGYVIWTHRGGGGLLD